MKKSSIIFVLAQIIIVNAIFTMLSYQTNGAFKLSILHIIFGTLPLVLFFRNRKYKTTN
jgi:hypothetical protein